MDIVKGERDGTSVGPVRIRWMSHTLFVLLLAVLFPSLVMADESALINEIRASANYHEISIETVQCRAVINRPRGGLSAISYFRDGNRYRVERDDLRGIDVGGGELLYTPYHVWTYDGERYCMFNEDDKTLKVTSGRGAVGSSDPVTIPFNWVAHLRCESPFRENLVSRESWDRIFEDVKLRGRGSCGGNECLVLEFTQACTDPVAFFRVFFLVDESYYPVRCERWLPSAEECDSFSEVIDFEKRIVGDRGFLVPLRHRYQHGEDFVTETIVDPHSVILNQPVGDELFTIATSAAKSVYNVQGETAANENPKEKRTDEMRVSAASRFFGFFVLISLLLVCFSLPYVWRSKGAVSGEQAS